MRTTYPKECPQCGETFAARTTLAKYCSRKCTAMARAAQGYPRRDGPRDKWGRLGIVKSCTVCGTEFIVPANESLTRKTCSRACSALAKRGKLAERKGAANPAYRSGARSGINDRQGQRRWRSALQEVCTAPGCTTPTGNRLPLFLHHVCYRQHVVRAGGDIWDPRNAMTICNACHASHHKRGRVLLVTSLPDSAIEFGFELFGDAALDYFRRYYVDDDDIRLAERERAIA